MKLVLLLLGVGCAWAQLPVPAADQCMYHFTVPAQSVSAQCMTTELKETLAKVNEEYDVIKAENQALKQQLDDVVQEYADMVETVKTLKRETASWRAIVNWPEFDEKFKPENLSLIMKETPTFKDCQAALSKGPKKAGIYHLKPKGSLRSFFDFCDEEGWTVFFRRFDGKVDFHRTWNEFVGGFGELTGEFFIGLEQLHLLTSQGNYQFHMEGLGWNGKLYWAQHDDFEVLGELQEYALLVGNMTEGNYYDVMSEMNGTMFTTSDRDNDDWGVDNCATYYRGGWWQKNCGSDPSRGWCDGHGCMSWGDIALKKVILKVKPMAKGGRPDKSGKRKRRNKGK